jgi:hypothetical protein
MLFDLRGRGRRRTVQVIYLGLALLMGGGLVLFGIGGDVQGGLFDAFSQNNNSASAVVQEQRDDAAKRVEQRPNDANLWAQLAQAEFNLAGQSDGYNEQTGEFSGEAREHLVAAQKAWQRHVRLVGDSGKVNGDVAATMRGALSALGDAAGAVQAQEMYIDTLDAPGFGDFAQLAQLAYAAGQNRKGDLAADRAVELAPKDQRKDVKQQLESVKTQAATQALKDATTGAGG